MTQVKEKEHNRSLSSQAALSSGGGKTMGPPAFRLDASPIQAKFSGEEKEASGGKTEAPSQGFGSKVGGLAEGGGADPTQFKCANCAKSKKPTPLKSDFTPSLSREGEETVQAKMTAGFAADPQAKGNPVQMQGRREGRGRNEREYRAEDDNLSNFCVPFSTGWQASAAEAQLWSTLIPSSWGMFGEEVMNLWRIFLNSSPGSPSAMHQFGDNSQIGFGFYHNAELRARQSRLMNVMAGRLDRIGQIPANTWYPVSISSLLSQGERNHGIRFNNPYDIPGHVAGGAGGWDTGTDSRRANGNVELYRTTDREGNTTQITMRNAMRWRIIDALDFCPGQPGTGLEQLLTIPLSRLEAGGQAHDVPFQVDIAGPPEDRRITGAALGNLYPTNANDAGRNRNPRDEREGGNRSRSGRQRDDARRRLPL